MDTPQSYPVAGPSTTGARQIPVRARHPRQLIIYNEETGEWNVVNDSNPKDKERIIRTKYLAVSYRQSDFPEKDKLVDMVRGVCDIRNLNAYWLDFACTGDTQDEKNEDLYRIADVFRTAEETVIMIPDNKTVGWKSWGGRVWTFPEALLSRTLIYKEGKKRPEETSLHQVANLAYKDTDDEDRLVSIYESGGKDFARFRDRFEDLCRGIWSRTSGPGTSIPKDPQFTAWPGERVYALMGFLQRRIEPKQHETEKEAFIRLLKMNGLECENYPWETDKEFRVWDKDDRRTAEDISSPYYVPSAKYSDSRCAVKNPCEQGTRVAILDQIDTWLKLDSANEDSDRVFWIHGLAGSGKSTIALTVAESCNRNGTLAATFFCSRHSAECSNILNIFCTISYQLCQIYEPFRLKVSEAMKQNRDLCTARVEVQLEDLIVQPLRALLAESSQSLKCYVIVIDALDECNDDRTENIPSSKVLSALSKHVHHLAPLKILITSRPEENIRSGFRIFNLSSKSKSHDISYEVDTGSDILKYLRNSFHQVHYKAAGQWPSDEDLGILVVKADGLFIFASTAVKFLLDDAVRDRDQQLRQLLDYEPVMTEKSPYAYLDNLYLQILQNKLRHAEESLLDRLKTAFAILLAALEPLSIAILDGLLTKTSTLEIFQDLHSIVSISENEDASAPVRLIHPSIQDFLTNEERCTNRFFVKRPNNILTECCAMKLLQCMDGGTDAQKLRERAGTFKSGDQKEKDAIGYASYYIDRHFENFGVNDLKDKKEIIISFLSDMRFFTFLLTKDMGNWVETSFLNFLMDDSLSRKICLKLYSLSVVLLNLKSYGAGNQPYIRTDDEEITDSQLHQLLETKEILAAKYPDFPAFKIKAKEFVHLESLLFFIQLYFEEAYDLSDELTEMYRLLGSQVGLNKARSSEFGIIAKRLAEEIIISLSLSLLYSPLEEELRRCNCERPKLEWMDIKQILKRYKDLICYSLDGDGHSLSNLYEAAFTTIRRQYSTQYSDEMRDLFHAIVAISQNHWDESVLSFFFRSASVHLSASLNLLDKLQLFYFVRDPDADVIVANVSDMNLLSFKEIHESTGAVNIILPECTSYKQMLSRHRQHKDNPKYKKHIYQSLIFNQSVLVELAKETLSSLVTEEVQISVYENSFHNLMARWCLSKVKEVLLQVLDGGYYYHRASRFPCIDLTSSLKMSKDDEVTAYAMGKWSYHVWQCASNFDGFTLQLMQDILSHGSDLYCAIPQEIRQSALDPDFLLWIMENLLDREPAVTGKSLQLLYENAVLFYLGLWIDGESSYRLRTYKLREKKYSYNDGLYGLDEDYTDLRVTLLAYKIGYMKNLEITNDQKLVEKALNVRKLAKAAHDTIMKRRVPEKWRTKRTIKGYMKELDRILKKNRRPLFVGDSKDEDDTDSDDEDDADSNDGDDTDSDDGDDTDSNDEDGTDSDDGDDTGPDDSKLEESADENRMVLSQAVDACSAAIKTFLRRLDKTLGVIESNNDSEINARANLVVGGNGDIVPRIGAGEDSGHSIDKNLAIERNEDEAVVRASAELEDSISERQEVVMVAGHSAGVGQTTMKRLGLKQMMLTLRQRLLHPLKSVGKRLGKKGTRR